MSHYDDDCFMLCYTFADLDRLDDPDDVDGSILYADSRNANLVAENEETDRKHVHVHWATPMLAANLDWDKTAYVAMGNEASLGHQYNCLCLIASVGLYGCRQDGKDLEHEGGFSD